MRHFLRLLGVAMAMLVAVSAFAADAELPDKEKLDKVLKEKLDKILNEIQDVKHELADFRTSSSVQIQKTIADVGEIQQRLKNLEQAVEQLSTSQRRISAYFNPSAPPATGTIRIQNRYGLPATVSINGQPYSIPPFEERRVAGVPVGNFTYEVQAEGFGVIQNAVSRPLTANETFSIFINPPALTPIP